ncbi:MAG: ABC transporter ATP-binding protein [Myxococcota bacterium]|nr:ABC transporter ATP-binding protein [Myxococcales bacterium]
MIALRGLARHYGGRAVVDGIDLDVAARELVVLIGASGCGKTTTLKMINRLVEPTAGSVHVAGRDASQVPAHELRRRIGYGFQRVGLFPHMTVGENVAVTPRLLGWDAGRIAARVDALLELVRLPPREFRDRDPAELSGGQRQRVGLARALAAEPEVLLLDEPFGALDPITRDHLQQELAAIRDELALTIVFVTHDMGEALLLADRIAVLDAGRLVRVGTPAELLAAPGSDRVAELLSTPERQLARIEALRAAAARPGSA